MRPSKVGTSSGSVQVRKHGQDLASAATARSRSRRIGIAAGGAALLMTWLTWNLSAFWGPSQETIDLGNTLFKHQWQPNDVLAAEGDGLGPVFNAKSCVECHFLGGVGGAGTNEHNVSTFEAHPTRNSPNVHNGVVHASATHPEYLELQKHVQELFPIVKGGTKVIRGCRISTPDFNPVIVESVNTPALFGSNLIDEVSKSSLVVGPQWRVLGLIGKELSLDFEGTPIGRPHILPDGRVGRFGWKAQFATLEEFVAAACAVEMGLTNPLRAQHSPQKFAEDTEAKLDLDKRQFRALVAFVESLPRPEQVLPESLKELNQVRHGEALFKSVGCADCHTPDIGGVAGVYSDFMLHRVDNPDHPSSPGYGDGEPDVPLPTHHPLADEWKTPPLWGVADSAPYFHDGRYATLELAIQAHHGQARHVTKKYMALPQVERSAVVDFLKTLRAPQAVEQAPVSPSALAVAER